MWRRIAKALTPSSILGATVDDYYEELIALLSNFYASLAQSVRAIRLHRIGRRFEPYRMHHFRSKMKYIRWTYPCWISNDLEETIGNSFPTKVELYDNMDSVWRAYKEPLKCNCDNGHKAIKITIEIK